MIAALLAVVGSGYVVWNMVKPDNPKPADAWQITGSTVDLKRGSSLVEPVAPKPKAVRPRKPSPVKAKPVVAEPVKRGRGRPSRQSS